MEIKGLYARSEIKTGSVLCLLTLVSPSEPEMEGIYIVKQHDYFLTFFRMYFWWCLYVPCIYRMTGGSLYVPCMTDGSLYVPCIYRMAGGSLYVPCIYRMAGGSLYVPCIYRMAGGSLYVPCIYRMTGGS